MTKPGVWQHFKGGLYRVLGNARLSTNGPDCGASMVIYVSLAKGTVHVRAELEFHQRVDSFGTPLVALGRELDEDGFIKDEPGDQERFCYQGDEVRV